MSSVIYSYYHCFLLFVFVVLDFCLFVGVLVGGISFKSSHPSPHSDSSLFVPTQVTGLALIIIDHTVDRFRALISRVPFFFRHYTALRTNASCCSAISISKVNSVSSLYACHPDLRLQCMRAISILGFSVCVPILDYYVCVPSRSRLQCMRADPRLLCMRAISILGFSVCVPILDYYVCVPSRFLSYYVFVTIRSYLCLRADPRLLCMRAISILGYYVFVAILGYLCMRADPRLL